MALGEDSGEGPLPPVKGVAPVPSMQSSAPNAVGPRPQGQDAPSLEASVPGAQPSAQPQQPPDFSSFKSPEPTNPSPHYEGYHEDAFSSAYDEPPVVQHKSVGGFVKNLGDDVGGFISGIPAAFRVAWNSGTELSGDHRWVDDLHKHPEYLTQELNNTWTTVLKSFTDTYKDGVGEALYKHPFSVFMDATTIADIVGGGVKAAGRAAMTTLEREAVETGAKIGGVGEHLLNLGDRIQRFPGDALKAPFEAAGNLALKVPQIRTLAETFALTPLGMAEKNAMTAQVLKGRVTAAQAMEEILERNLSTAQREEYWALRDGHIPLDAASDPILSERAELWQRANKDYEVWMMQMGIKTGEELGAARLKPLAERLYNDAVKAGEPVGQLYDLESGAMSGEWLKKAAEYRDGANPWRRPTQPSYHPFFAERTFDLGEMLRESKSQANTTNYVKRFEKKTGYGPGIVTNPDVVEARAMLQINELKSMVDYISDSTVRLGKPVKFGSEIPAGHVLMDPILKKYIEHGLVNGVELLSKNFAAKLHELSGGRTLFDVLKDSHAETAKMLDQMGLWKDLKDAVAHPEAWQVAIPKEVAYLIESQLKGVTGPLRFYDKMLNTWRNVVLRLMPRFYINNLLGHSTLLMFGGHLPFLKSMARDEKLLPAESLSSMGIQADAGYRSDLIGGLPGMDKITKFTEAVANTTGSVPRQLLLNTKMQDILAHDAAIGDATAKAMIAGKTMEEAVNAAYAARKELQELGAKQLIKAKELAGGDLDAVQQAIRGEKKPVFTPEQQAQLADIDKQLKEFDVHLKKGDALSNATTQSGPSKAVQDQEDHIKFVELRKEKAKALLPQLKAELEDLERQMEEKISISSGHPYEEVEHANPMHDGHLLEEDDHGFNPDADQVMEGEAEDLDRNDPTHNKWIEHMRTIGVKPEVTNHGGGFKEYSVPYDPVMWSEKDLPLRNAGDRWDFMKLQMEWRKRFHEIQKLEDDALRLTDKDHLHLEHLKAEDAKRTLVGPETVKQGIKDAMARLVEERDKLHPLGRADWVSQDMKHLSDLQEMSARREYLAPIAHKVEEGVRQMEQFLGNYGRMHPLESKIVRRIIPFWTFQKTMGKLLMQLPIVAPKVSFLWNQYAKLMIDAANDDRLPDRFRNAIPIGHSENPDGDVDTIFMKIDGFSPFRDLGMTTFGKMPIPKQLDPMQNPLIKLGVESMGGYDNFTEKPFTESTDFVTLNGAVWRFDPAAQELKQVVPQKPIIDSLFNQIPHLKIVQEALDSFDKTRPIANAISQWTSSNPTATPQNADGDYTYNRHWWWAASRAMGFPVHVANPERVEMLHNNMVQNMMTRYYGELHRVDPDTQAKLERILEDLGNGGWKLREWGN